MSTQRGVEGDVAWFLEGADEVARAKNRLQYCGGIAGICPQVAVAQIGCGEKCSAASEIQNKSQLDRASLRDGPNSNAPREDGAGCAKSSTVTSNAPAPSYHLGDAARIIAIGLVDLRLQPRLHVPRLDTDHW
jgi:hypothetical protein